MKEEATVSLPSGGLRLIKDRRFVWRSGQGWVDTQVTSSMKILKIKAFSPLYFQILQRKPEWKPFFALGSHLVLRLDRQRALQIGDEDDPSLSLGTILR